MSALSAVVAPLLVTSAGVAEASAEAQRLAGSSRYQTAVQIAQHGFEDGADVVYLARGDGFADALAAGALSGGPILLVPPDGSVPGEVAAEVARQDPDRVVALGGRSAVPEGTLARLAGGRSAARLAGGDRYQTAVQISRHGFPSGSDVVYLSRSDGFADALAAGSLSGGPILLVPPDGGLPAEVVSEVARLDPDQVVALGGVSAVPESTLARLATGRDARRLAGPSRYDTAAAITRHGFPSGSPVLYLARSDGFADALAAAALNAPLLLVPPTGPVPPVVLTEAVRLDPERVVALGGEQAVSTATLTTVAALQQSGTERPPPPRIDPTSAVPLPAAEPDPQSTGGPVGGAGGQAPPPPRVVLPRPAEPWQSVGELAGLERPGPLPPGPTYGLPSGDMPSGDDAPEWAPPVSGGERSAQVVHDQPVFRTWAWDQLPYGDLPAAVGRIYGSRDGVNWFGQCTGTVIGSDQVLTAGHCLSSGGAVVPYYRFYPDLHGSQARYGYWEATSHSAFPDPRYWADPNNAFYADYAVLKVAANSSGQRVGDVVGAFPVYLDGDQFTSNRFTIGYPSEGMYSAENAAISQHGQCAVESCLPYYCWSPVGQQYSWESTGYYKSIGFGCYGNGGWSGGPVFQYDNGNYYLVSVVSTGWNHVGYACTNPVRCHWYGQNSWGPTFRAATFGQVWAAAQ